MKKSGWLIGLTLIFLMTLILTACSGAGNTNSEVKESNETGSEQGSRDGNEQAVKELEKKKITIGLPTATASSFTPIYMARDKGFYKDEGLEVEVVGMGGNSQAMQAIAGGSVDIVFTSLSGLVDAIKANQPMVAFWGYNNGIEFTIHSKTADSMADLKGKRIGISSFGGLTDLVTRVGLEKAGLDPEKDVEILVIAGGAQPKVAAMETGQIDAAILTSPTSFSASDEGYKEIFSQADINPTFPTKVAIASESFVKKNPETIKAFLRGLQHGVDYMTENPEEGAKDLVNRVNYEENYSIQAIEEILPGFPKNGEIDQSGIDTFWEIAERAGDVDGTWSDDQWLDRSFIDTAKDWLRK
ncbi:ABC transporter substrate-binding protein [Neobacillus niacini]|uniref:ABC transporter substrate-binding protein n=1 Tax=Neobacillus niacini TaxID=86668 RepID=UPI002FFE3830